MTATVPTPSVFDVNALTSLKAQAKSNDPEAIHATARQFEALFVQMVLKSMRDTVPQDGLFDNQQSRMFESMLDQQLSLSMAGKDKLGLAEMIERQMKPPSGDPQVFKNGLPLNPTNPGFPLNSKNTGLPLDEAALARLSPHARSALMHAYAAAGNVLPQSEYPHSSSAALSAYNGTQDGGESPADFVARMRPHAEAIEQQTGIPAHFMVAQAALETGWGHAEPRFADGRNSFNLFGIKAGRNWSGSTVEASTLEYVNGQPQRQTEHFRAYGSYAEAFSDYARLLSDNPRYSAAAASRSGPGFARALQNAGYASDPEYARKLERIIDSPALRGLQRS